jgi:hypothetical protein
MLSTIVQNFPKGVVVFKLSPILCDEIVIHGYSTSLKKTAYY